MKWKTKARIQNLIAMLPNKLSYDAYYIMQKHFGKLYNSDPFVKLNKVKKVVDLIHDQKKSINGKDFFELGTGYRLNAPLALWLLGVNKTITIDLNPYLKWELIQNDILRLQAKSADIEKLYSDAGLNHARFSLFKSIDVHSLQLNDILEMCHIDFRSPADARKLDWIADDSIDYYFSNDVLEHIPPAIINACLVEGHRVLKDDGLMIHLVDFTDHFSHSDQSIHALNFLRYSDKDWASFSGNRYMYMNRARVDDISRLLEDTNFRLLRNDDEIDADLLSKLDNKLIELDEQFCRKNHQHLATLRAWFVCAATPGTPN